MDVGRRAFAPRAVELVRTDVDEGRQVAVVGPVEDEQVPLSGMGPRQAEGEVVGLAPGVHEETHTERFGQLCAEAFGVVHEVVVQVAGVGIQHRHLAVGRRDHPGMAVSHVGHVVHGVEEGAAFIVVQVLHVAPDNLQGTPVGDAQGPADVLTAGRQDLLPRPLVRRERPGGHAQYGVRIRGQAPPDVPLARCSHAREIPLLAQHVGDDLKMQVGRPTAVYRRVAERGESLPFFDPSALVKPVERFDAQMPVERVESQGRTVRAGRIGCAVRTVRAFRFLRGMFQDDAGAVVQRLSVVPEAVDLSLHRREDR